MEEVYLGDGLYAGFDGWQIVLKANDSINPTDTVYLEPAVLHELIGYAIKVGVIPKREE